MKNQSELILLLRNELAASSQASKDKDLKAVEKSQVNIIMALEKAHLRYFKADQDKEVTKSADFLTELFIWIHHTSVLHDAERSMITFTILDWWTRRCVQGLLWTKV